MLFFCNDLKKRKKNNNLLYHLVTIIINFSAVNLLPTNEKNTLLLITIIIPAYLGG